MPDTPKPEPVIDPAHPDPAVALKLRIEADRARHEAHAKALEAKFRPQREEPPAAPDDKSS